MTSSIRRIFTGGSGDIVVQPLTDKDDRFKEKSEQGRFYLVFEAKGFEKTNISVHVIDAKRVQIVATRREQLDEKTTADDTIFYEQILSSDVDAMTLTAAWFASKKKLVITAARKGGTCKASPKK